MASTNRKIGVTKTVTPVEEERIKYICYKCGSTSISDRFSNMVKSDLFEGMNHRIPICKNCLTNLYFDYLRNSCDGNEKSAIRRICTMYDIYYNDEIVDMAKSYTSESLIMNYFKAANAVKFNEHKGKTYTDTIIEDKIKGINSLCNSEGESTIPEETKKFFGKGLSDEDYEFLKDQYDDWITRHECKTKAQEEVFKRLSFKQLEILKATRANKDTKDLDGTYQNLLGTANLQPKQNSTDSTSDAQTFGTLIQKWETTRPLPEIDESLRDVDKIGLYIDVFFKGHLAKMMGLKNGLSNLYSKFMEKYTVKKPEYDDDENSEALFDAIFGNSDTSEE